MPVAPIPEGYHSVTPYLMVRGVGRLIGFLKAAFDATEVVPAMKRSDGTIAHAEYRIRDSIVMMGEPMGRFEPMPSTIHLYVSDADAVYERALRAGAASIMEPANQFYGDRSAGVRDSCGNIWWIATHTEDVGPQELAKRAEAWLKQQRRG